MDTKTKIGIDQEGKEIHYSVGSVIKQNDKYLLIDRAQPEYGWAGPAGHIDEGEDAITALRREIEEEVGLTIEKYNLLYEEEVSWNWCNKGIKSHYWYLYGCETIGEVSRNFRETKAVGWFSPEEIRKLKLEPVWEYWLKKMKII